MRETCQHYDAKVTNCGHHWWYANLADCLSEQYLAPAGQRGETPAGLLAGLRR
ncbi:MAG TPA: hypothetical protein VMP68_10890 [Candidatus Eisenbacteria bacterium]|nr:hypothetical protein [Candidatus Eisenbacteria bacterium]